MKLKKGKAIITFTKDFNTYSVRCSEHGFERMEQRQVDENNIISAVFALGLDELKKARKEKKDIAVIDEKNDFAVIVGMKKNTINIITVIAKSDIYLKEGTAVKKI